MVQENGRLVINYNLGDVVDKIVEAQHRYFNDSAYHYVTFTRHENNVTIQVDDLMARFRTYRMCLPLTRFSLTL